MTSAPIRVVVVASRRGRDRLLRALAGDGTAVVGETDRSDLAVERVAANDADVVVVDLGLEDDGGVDAITQVMTLAPRPVLVLVPPERADPDAGLDAGALEAHRRPARHDHVAHARLRDRIRSLRDVSILPRLAAESHRSASERPKAVRGHPAGSGLLPTGHGSPLPLAALAGAPSAVVSVLSGLGDVRFPVIVSVHLLTGTGRDGTSGLRALRCAKGAAIVQDTAATSLSSLPNVRIMPLGRIAAAIREAASRVQA